MAQPVVARAHQTVIALRTELFVFAPPNLIDGFGKVLGNMEFIEDDFAVRLGQVLERRGDVGVLHIHRNSPDSGHLFDG